MKNTEELGHWFTKVGFPEAGQLGAPSKKGEAPPVTAMSQIIKIAAAHEFGANIKHPGGTAYRTIAIGGEIRAIFISNKEAEEFDRRTRPHTIEIPERPFMRMSFDNNRGELQTFKAARVLAVARGKEDAVTAIKKIGEFMTNKTKMTIRGGQFQPLSRATVLRKHSSRPLIDTSQMINSVQHLEERRQ